MEPFKNMISEQVAKDTALAISRNYPEFNQKNFLKGIKSALLPLELKDRVILIANKLHDHLPKDQKKSLKILLGAIKKNDSDDVGLSGFAAWPLTEYVALFGLEEFDLSMNILKEMTKAFTSEFAVRAFFLHDESRTLKFFKSWVNDKNEHVRRWVSEGSRPLLPWGQKLPGFVQDPLVTWGLLEVLKNDESEYVRKSVANHINDHSKNHPDLVVEKLLSWKRTNPQSKELDWVIRHATRTLIKKGHSKAFLLHGVEAGKIEVLSQKILTKKVRLGEALKVEVVFKNLSKKKIKVILDHELHLLKSNGSHNIKCFKGKSIELASGEMTKLSFNVPLKPVTTRTYYSGKHYWNILVNGKSEDRLSFVLDV
ncbi:MAG: DNA alkylation repair protein [Bdellovibrionales bacterium]|nr:DNA alkylation repair protein [Bdellovibrionales bacterium]